MPNTDNIKKNAVITGASYLAIQSALEVSRSRRPDLSQCLIEVVNNKAPELVIFTCKGEQFGVKTETGEQLNADSIKLFSSKMIGDSISDIIQGSDYRAIQSAMETFRRHNPDMVYYIIEVVRRGDSVIVIFTDKDRPPGTLGSIGTRPEFEVEMEANNLKVLRAYFLR